MCRAPSEERRETFDFRATETIGPPTALTARRVSPRSARAMQEQAMKGHGFGLEGIELDLREMAFLDFAPAVDARLGLLSLAAV